MNEPPAQVLYRLMQKKRIIPQYSLIFDGTGARFPTFTYQITCDGLVKTGTGFSKKEAKHNAAKAILNEISQRSDSTELPIKSVDTFEGFQPVTVPQFPVKFVDSPQFQPVTVPQFPVKEEYQPDIVPQFPVKEEFPPDIVPQFPVKEEFPPDIVPEFSLENVDEPPKREMSPIEDSILPKKEQNSPLNIATALEKVCRRNNLAIPEYKIKKYCKFGTTVFKVECVLSSFKETATEETLDKAMQEAARKTWAKLQIEWQKPKNIKQQEEENFERIVNNAENLLKSFAKENQANVCRKSRKMKFAEETLFDVKQERNSESWEDDDSYVRSPKRRKLPEVKKEEECVVITEFSVEKPSSVLFLNPVEVLNQLCIDINLQKPIYEYTTLGLECAQFFNVTCTISTFQIETRGKSKDEAKHEAAKKMIEKIQSAVEKLQNSKKLDLRTEEAKFFVNGTVMGLLETISDETDVNSSSKKKSMKIEDDDDSCMEKKKLKSKSAITMLKEFCKSNNLKKPRFDVLEHNLFYSDNYKVACVVSTFKEESQGKCIEEAKVKSAQKILEKIKKLQNSYLEELISSVKSLDFRNPLRWKSKY